MGIISAHLNFLARENKNHPITGDVLTLGQQGVQTTFANAKEIMGSYGPLSELKSDFDTKPKIPGWIGTVKEKFTNAQTIFSLLGAKNVFVCDYSDYEKPDFTFDMNYPVSDEYKERFDVVFDSGTLEHIFDISTSFRNVDFMLKPGGQMIIFSPASNMIDHGFFSFNPTLFHDYFKSRGYSNFHCYIREFSPFFVNTKGNAYQYHNVGDQLPLFSKHSMEVMFFATKGPTTKVDVEKPIQTLYAVQYSGDTQAKRQKSTLGSLAKNLYSFLKPVMPVVIDRLLVNKARKKNASNISFIGKY
ncbi:MAG: class I SAM-dependent methyltransferase [Ferruginibacter sp.]